MKFKEGLTLRKLAGEYIIVKPELGMQDMTNVFSLNSTSAYLWENLYGKDFSIEDVITLLLEKYAVDKDTAQTDAIALIDLFRANNLVLD
jgi:hypothetical protein